MAPTPSAARLPGWHRERCFQLAGVCSRSVTPAATATTSRSRTAGLSDITQPSTVNATLGVSTGTVVLATFTDGNPNAQVGDDTASVNFGGPVTGTPSASIQLVSRTATVSTWQVVGSVTYAAAGSYAVTVT